MRTLTMTEMTAVSGGTGVCTPSDGGNTYGGVSDTSSLGDELIEIYEGLVQATSHIMERVALAL